MPKPTDSEFKIARTWLEQQLDKNPDLKLPCKINRIKSKKDAATKQTKTVGDIPTNNSFLAFPVKGGFVLGAIARWEEDLGQGTSSTAKKIYWEPHTSIPQNLKSKVSIILDRMDEVENISDITDVLYGGDSVLYQKSFNKFTRPSNIKYVTGITEVSAKTKSYVVSPYAPGVTVDGYFKQFEVDLQKLPAGATPDMYYRDGEITPLRILILAMACTKAVQSFCEKGLTHGSIHANNIIINEKDDVLTAKLIDFGNSKKVASTAGTDEDTEKLGYLFYYFFIKLPKSKRHEFENFYNLSVDIRTRKSEFSFDDIKSELTLMILNELTLKSILDKIGLDALQNMLPTPDTIDSSVASTSTEYSYWLMYQLVSTYASKIGMDISEMDDADILRSCGKLEDDFLKLGAERQPIHSINKAIVDLATASKTNPKP